MTRSPHARRLLPALTLFALPALASAFSEDQWRCTAASDGSWQCVEVAVDAGPFKPVATAPVVNRSASRDQGPKRPAGQTEEMAALTWVPRQALPQSLGATVPPWCGGAYKPLEWPEDVLAADPETTLVTLSAQQGEYLLDEAALLEGGVSISQGPRSVEAELARYDALEDSLALEGKVLVREPGILLRGDAAELELATGDARVDGARFVLYEGGYRGEAAKLSRTEAGLRIDDGEITRCEPGHEGWKVTAGRIEIPEEGRYAIATDARLEVYDVPVFWAPRLTVPVSDERTSGFLFPSVGFSGENGVDASLPYYFNLAPNYDATFTPRLMTERGLLLQGEFRQLSARMENTIGGAFLAKDDNYNGEYSFNEFKQLVRKGRLPPDTFRAEQRWLGRFDHRGTWAPGLTTDVDILAVSDDDYLRDIGTDLYSNGLPEVERNASLHLQRGGLEATLWAQDIRILQEDRLDTYARLPQVDLSWHKRLGNLPIVFGIDSQYAKFDRRDSLAAGRDAISGDRVHVAPRFTLPLEWDWGWMEATAALKYTRYGLQLPAELDKLIVDPATGTLVPNALAIEDDPTRTLPTGSVDIGLRFERDAAIAGMTLLQTLEPRLYYLYTKREHQRDLPIFDTADLTFGVEQLFRENRFSGIDRINDANQLTAAVTSRLISRSDGSELLSATAGRIFHLDQREVTLDGAVGREQKDSASGWVSELVLRLGGGYDAKALWVWHNEDDDLDQGLLRLRYRGSDPRSLFNVAYRTRGEGIDQLDLSFSWPLRPNMALIGRYFYDIEQEEVLEALAGVQYDDCCWRLRLVGRQFLRPTQAIEGVNEETGVFIEVVMKGLAGFDSGLGSVLEQGIHGFEQRQDTNAFHL